MRYNLCVGIWYCSPFSQVLGKISRYISCNISLCGGESVVAGVCANGGSYIGDTVMSLYDSMGLKVAENDDSSSCGSNSLGSEITFTPASAAACDVYVLREYCYAGTTCSGTSAVEVIRLSTAPTCSPTCKLQDRYICVVVNEYDA